MYSYHIAGGRVCFRENEGGVARVCVCVCMLACVLGGGVLANVWERNKQHVTQEACTRRKRIKNNYSASNTACNPLKAS